MKKLMIAAAVAAMTVGAFAAECSETPDCGTVFEVKFSGKTGTQVLDKNGGDKGYASVQKISGKGTLTVADYATELLDVKVGKYSDVVLLEDGEVIKWSIFGKNYSKVADPKPGKSYSVESDFGVVFADQDEWAVTVTQVAFGKAKVKISKGSTSVCGESTDPCIPTVVLKKYSGWFAGWYSPTCADFYGYEDDCISVDEEIALVGGTWSAKVK